MKKIICSLFLLLTVSSYAQDKNITTVDQTAQYSQGPSALETYLAKSFENEHFNLKNIHVGFIVEKDGRISNVEVLKTTVSKEALDFIKSIFNPMKWTPAVKNNIVVRSKIIIPIL